MGLQNWSTTPANNATGAPNINMATGSAPSTVHPSVRQMMADVAAWYADPEWLIQADVPTYTSATTFTVPGNRTSTYSVNRRVQAAGTGYTIVGTITASVYGTVTTVTVVWDSGALDNTVTTVAVGILSPSNIPGNPSGTILDFAGATPPAGYLLCDGSAYSRTTYAALFTAIGTTWGAGDGSTTFNVPDLRGRTTIGAGTGSGLSPRTLGTQNIGEENHVLVTAELAAHNHTGTVTITDPTHVHQANDVTGTTINVQSGGGAQAITSLTGVLYTTTAASTGITATTTIANNGSSTGHNTMQPSAVLNKIIKT